jgi:hypothetical protein
MAIEECVFIYIIIFHLNDNSETAYFVREIRFCRNFHRPPRESGSACPGFRCRLHVSAAAEKELPLNNMNDIREYHIIMARPAKPKEQEK